MSRNLMLIIFGTVVTLAVAGVALLTLALGRDYFPVAGPVATTTAPSIILETPDATASATVPAEAVASAEAVPSPEATAPAEVTGAAPTPAAISVSATSVEYILALADVNIRSGPGTNYNVVGWLAAGQLAKVTGVNDSSGWWRVACPDGSTGNCWITGGSQHTRPAAAPGATPAATASAACTNSASLVSDVTVPDGAQYAPNTGFDKTWRIRNTGTCTWNQAYRLVHAGGHLVGAIATGFSLPGSVAPGQSIDLTVSLVSPAAPDTYQGDWKLQDPQGRPFGVGRDSSPFWVRIVVSTGQLTTISGLVYEDGNQNGVYDNGETLAANREVWLVPGTACHVRRDAVATTVSGNNGRYILSGNFGGNYCVGLVGSAGLDDVVGVAVSAGQALDNINLKSPVPSGSISGYLWDDYCLTTDSGDAVAGNCVADANGDYHADGMLQATEGTIPGVTILLQAGACATDNPVAATSVTDATGRYFFGNLRPGAYCVSMNAASPANAPLLLPGDWTFPQRGIWYQEITLRGFDNAFPVNFGWDYQLR